jgi:hypothetical protein
LGKNGKAKEFNNKEEVVLFLRNHGVYDKDIGHFIYKEVDKEKSPESHEHLLKPQKNRKGNDLEDGRGR